MAMLARRHGLRHCDLGPVAERLRGGRCNALLSWFKSRLGLQTSLIIQVICTGGHPDRGFAPVITRLRRSRAEPTAAGEMGTRTGAPFFCALIQPAADETQCRNVMTSRRS